MFYEVRVPILLVVALVASLSVQGKQNKRQDAIGNVDFILGMDSTARLYTSGGNSSYDTLLNIPGFVETVDYHLAKHLIFAYANDKLYKTNFDPQSRKVASTPKAQLVKYVSRCPGLAVDWVYDRIYWAKCDTTGASIMSFGLDGEKEHTVLSKSFDSYVYSMEIDPYRGLVFWAVYEVIMSVETSGEGFNPEVTKTDYTNRMMALDLRMRRLYYVDTTSLFSTDYTGGEKVEHFSVPQLWRVNGLSILGDKVYWEKEDNKREVIYEAPLNLTETEDVKIIRTIDKTVFYLRAMHPSLQRMDPWPQSCVASGATSETRVCPPGQTLYHDGVSCHTDVLGHSGCAGHDNCPASKTCIQGKCDDPCVGLCGNNTSCTVHLYVPSCACKDGYKGNPFLGCSPLATSRTCPPIPHRKKRFYLETSQVNWHGALTNCLMNNTRLVSVESMEELLEINNEIRRSALPCERYWTSGMDYGDEGNFVWVSSGTRLPTTSELWRVGQPDNLWELEQCVTLEDFKTGKTLNHLLNDYECTFNSCYVCQYYE